MNKTQLDKTLGTIKNYVDSTSVRRIKKTIDLTNKTTYPENKWFPCTAYIPTEGMRMIEVAVHLDSGSKPSWSTHNGGFSCCMRIETLQAGWGTITPCAVCTVYTCSFTTDSINPCGYSQLTNASNAVLWLRGGGKYFVYTDWNATWIPYNKSTTISNETIEPKTSCPGVSLTKTTLIANLNGNAATATKLATARNITIGNKTNSFDGSGNISFTLADIGAAASSHGTHVSYGGNGSASTVSRSDHTHSYIPLAGSTAITGVLRSNSEFQTTSPTGFRIAGTYGTMLRSDATSTYFLLTNKNDPYGNWNSLRPFTINNSTGAVSFGHGITGSLTGNASTATKLATARTLTIGSKGKTFDGSGNVSWTLDEIGAAPKSHTHNYAGSSSAGGAAYTSNVLNSNSRMDYGWNGLNYFNISGTAGNAAKANDTPTTEWWHIIRCNHANSAGFYTDIAVPFNAQSMYYKRIKNGAVQDGGWVKLLDAKNFGDYAAPKSHGTHVSYGGNGSATTVSRSDHTHSYLPLSGGTLTGPVTVSGESRFHNGTYTDPLNGTGCAIKASGHVAVGGTIYEGGTSLSNKYASKSHTHSYLPLSGGNMTGAIKSNLTCSHIDGFKGKSIISSTAGAGSHVAVAKTNSNKGYFTLIGYQDYMGITYATKTKVDGGTNGFDHSVKLLDENGWSTFEGVKLNNGYEADLHLICGSRDTGLYLNANNFGLHDWQNNTTIVRYNYSAKKLELNGGTVVIGGKRAVVMENYDYNYKIRGGSGMSGADGYITFSW